MTPRISLVLTLPFVLCAAACSDPARPPADAAVDAPAVDLGADLAPEASADLAPDLATDAAVDLELDLTPDGPLPDAPSPPKHAQCSAAQQVALDAAGKLQLLDTTQWSTNEFASSIDCGGAAGPWAGPQGYYRVKLSGGKQYKVTLRPFAFDGALYAFPAATACATAAINAACKSPASASPVVLLSSDNPGPGAAELLRLAPAADGDWIVAVDAAGAGAAGAFALAVEALSAPQHAACTQAQAVTLTSGGPAVTLQGDTSDADNEHGQAVTCGGGAALDGPQLYYKVKLAAGDKLGLTLKPAFPARLYLFGAGGGCTAAAIDAGCGGTGMTVAAGKSAQLTFTPPSGSGGDYVVAVDGAAPTAGGPFSLTLRALTPPSNQTCINAKDLALDASGKVSVSGSTAGAVDEFGSLKCGGTATLDGPQVYYKLKQLSAGTTYRLLLTPTFAAKLYLFSSGASCKQAGIESDCAGGAGKGERLQATVAAGASRSLYFKPATTGAYFVAVDSQDAAAAGDFSLAISATSTPQNGSCLKAASLQLSGGKAQVTGETHGVQDELATLKCGGFFLLDGPQVYYKVALSAGQRYKLALIPTFEAYLYLYSPAAAVSCKEGALEQDCASKGASGLVIGPVPPGAARSVLFTPKSSGSYGLAVDSTDAGQGTTGYFGLNIETYALPHNDSCLAPAALTLSSSPLTVSGDTTGAVNEFGGAVSCGGTSALSGPQLYYKLSLKQGLSYTLTLAPKGWDAALYLFSDATCQPATVSAQCALYAADAAGLSGSETLSLTPAADQQLLLAVDTAVPTAGGHFTLTVAWK